MPIEYESDVFVNVQPNFADRDNPESPDSNPNGGVNNANTATDSRRGGRPGAPVNVAHDTTVSYDGMMGRGTGKKLTDADSRA